MNYHCPFCKKDVELEIEIESPSDYYLLDDVCPECCHPLPEDIDIYGAVMDHYACQADLLHDMMKEGSL